MVINAYIWEVKTFWTAVVDTTYFFDLGANDRIIDSKLQEDGKLVVVGYFTTFDTFPRMHICRLNLDGSVDTDFNPGTGANDWIYSIDIQSDGKIIIAGRFTEYDGKIRNSVARLNSDGTLDEPFDPGIINGRVYHCILDENDKIVISGSFGKVGGLKKVNVARLNSDGSVDSSFDVGSGPKSAIPNGNTWVNEVLPYSNGRYLVVGDFGYFNDSIAGNIVCVDDSGHLSKSINFNGGSDLEIITAIGYEDDKILIGGHFTTFSSHAIKGIARINSDGSIDEGFDIGTGPDNANVYEIVSISDGRIIATGAFDHFNGYYRDLVLLEADGSLNLNYFTGPGGIINSGGANDLEIDACDVLYVSGNFKYIASSPTTRLGRIALFADIDTSYSSISSCVPIFINSTEYNQTGVYPFSDHSTFGCKSVEILSLTIEPISASIEQVGDSLIASSEYATYQWVDCENGFSNIQGAVDSIFHPTEIGKYALVASNGICSDTSDCIEFLSTVIESSSYPVMSLLPNPSGGTFYLDTKMVIENIKVFSISGQVLPHSFDVHILKIEGAYEGIVYVLISDNSGRQYIRKVIIRR
ncbi:MAG: delta-60 repeat domain-containing protein [Saprospiraceae bacterium]|nr:delta-60 repeat domain-containing protein [Saprospiraceae bacterium]